MRPSKPTKSSTFRRFYFRQGEEFLEAVVEAAGNIASHFNVLDLVATDWNFMGIEHKDVGSHEDRGSCTGPFPRRDPDLPDRFRYLPVLRLYKRGRGSSGLLSVIQVSNPVQLHDFGDVALTVESGLFRIKSAGEPCGGNSLSRLMNHFRLMTFDDA